MAKPSLEDVFSHWSTLIQDFQTPTFKFYEAVGEVIRRREVPGVRTDWITCYEGGFGSARREYLRVMRDDLVFDICAAPFGTGYFFSWWLTPRQRPRMLVILSLVLLVALYYYRGRILAAIPWEWRLRVLTTLSQISGPLSVLLPIVGLLILYLVLARLGVFGSVTTVVRIPILGPLYHFVFRPITYYKVDTMTMFQTAVHSAVLEVIDGLTKAAGVRALSDGDRKPIMRAFHGRGSTS